MNIKDKLSEERLGMEQPGIEHHLIFHRCRGEFKRGENDYFGVAMIEYLVSRKAFQIFSCIMPIFQTIQPFSFSGTVRSERVLEYVKFRRPLFSSISVRCTYACRRI